MFGADNQFVVFDPQQVRINDRAPDVTITGFKLMNRPLLVDSLLKSNRIELAPQDNSITIEFSGLNYNGTYSISYKLDGLDKEWKQSDQFNQAIYSYLPPGHYTFLAKTVDAEGHSSKNITKLVITVKPPFWRTWWFLGLVVFGVIAVLFWLDKLRMQKLRATESIRTRIATSLTEEMSNSLSNINISSELAKTKVDTDKERTKEYIAQISETSNRMVEAMHDMVWSIDPKNDTMLNTIERMKSFAVETENLYDLDVVFDIDEAAADIDLDMARRYELLSIFKEAIANAARHSSARHVQVSLRLRNSRFFMMIEDDGNGFNADKATLGRGMNDMQRRAANINASFYIESARNTGTIVKLEMPV
jgi:signal transduction histidine kinase